MNKLYFFTALLLLSASAHAVPTPRLVVPADSNFFTTPLYSLDDSNLAFTDTTENRLFLAPVSGKKLYPVAQAMRIGRRFLFDLVPGRLVYRQSMAISNKLHDRIMSTSFYLYDPVMHTHNFGKIVGPYMIERKIWYRKTLLDPYVDYDGNFRIAGGYLDTDKGTLWVINAAGDTVYTSPGGVRIAAFEISPDGSYIAAVEQQAITSLALIQVETGRSNEIGAGLWPNWSLDSKSLVYLKPPSGATASTVSTICVYKLSGGSQQISLPPKDFDPETPSLNSDGTRIAFASKGAIYEIALTP